MKKLIYLIVLALILGLVLTGCSLLSNISQVPATEQSGITYLTKGGPTENEADEYTLYAGQNIPVGTVNVWNDSEILYVQYVVDDPWEMTYSHLYVGKTDPVNFPSTPGQFPYSPGMAKSPSPRASYDDTTMTYTIPLDEIYEYEFVGTGQGKGLNAIGTPGAEPCNEIYIAAQAEVFRSFEGNDDLSFEYWQEEPAWAVDEDAPHYFGKNWATYFTYNIALAIGDSYGGGIVAYFFQDNGTDPDDPGYVEGEQHGLIAAPADQSTGISWWNGSNVETGATGTAIGTGQANTTAIVTTQGAGSYAAQLCNDLTAGGYDDWFLPSKDELDKLYINKDAIGAFADYFYWSSSETHAEDAWGQDFVNGEQFDHNKNLATFKVRAVRAF